RDPVALVRSPERTAALAHPVDSRVGDLADPRSLIDAFESVQTLLVCSGHAPTMAELQLNAIAAARQAGVQRIVKISTSPASAFPGTPSRVAAQHLEIETALAASGIAHTNIRPNAFAQLIGGFAQGIARGELELTLADAAVSWVDAMDVGKVAAAALTADGPLPTHIEVTGPQALSGDQLAELLTQTTGRPVTYRPISDERNRARLLAAGTPEWLVEHVTTIFGLLRDRDGDRVTDAVREWTGRPATTMAEVLARDEGQLGIAAAVTAGESE
ncbi:MAG: NAD(P)H-binding protein, partial [Solirubrobacteraceae bacterium]